MNTTMSVDYFNDTYRQVSAKVLIYFDGYASTPLEVTMSNYLIDFRLLEEAAADSEVPLGSVSANEISITLLNKNQLFSTTNTASIYANKIQIGMRIEVYVQPTQRTTTDWIRLGIYYVSDWQCDIGSATASIVAQDKLALIGQRDTPALPVTANITVRDWLITIFQALGLVETTDFVIDNTLTQRLVYAWVEKQKMLATLQQFSEALFCYIYIDKANVIQVRNPKNQLTVNTTLTDQNQICRVSSPQSALMTYTGVEVKYAVPRISEVQTLVSLDNIVIPNGVSTLEGLALSMTPLARLAYIEIITLSGVPSVFYTSVTYTPWDISLTLNNTGASCTCNIRVYGHTIDTQTTSVFSKNSSPPANVVDKFLTIENYLIQQKSDAMGLSYNTRKFVQLYNAHIELEVRGNPLLEIGDTVGIQSVTDKISINAKPYRYEYEYDGVLKGTIKALNTAVLT